MPVVKQELKLDRVGEFVAVPIAGATDAAIDVQLVDVAVGSAVLTVVAGLDRLTMVPFTSSVTVTSGSFGSDGLARIGSVNGTGGVKGKAVLGVRVTTAQTAGGRVMVSVYPERYT